MCVCVCVCDRECSIMNFPREIFLLFAKISINARILNAIKNNVPKCFTNFYTLYNYNYRNVRHSLFAGSFVSYILEGTFATFLTLVLRESLAIFLLLCKSLKVIDISVKKQITLIYLFNIIAMNACICMYVYLYVPWMIKWSTTQATWILQDTMYDGTYRLFSSQLEKIRVHFFVVLSLSFILYSNYRLKLVVTGQFL